jgi:hypothetical protein
MSVNPMSRRIRWNRIFVVLFFIAAIALGIWGSIEFKRMIDNKDLQERLDEVRPPSKDS